MPVTATGFIDSGLAAATQYSWTVKAVDSNSVEGLASTAVTGATTGTAATCTTASNYAHTVAGRAYQLGGIAYANGSKQNMGLWNTAIIRTLKMTGPNYYVIGTCP